MNYSQIERIYMHFDKGHDLNITPGKDGSLCVTCISCKEDLFHFHKGNLTAAQREWFKSQAAENYEKEGEIEIDAEALISEGGDPGAYVQAWVWVEAPRSKYLCPKCMSGNVTAYVKRIVSRTVGIGHGEKIVSESDVDEDIVKEEPPHEFKCSDCNHVSEQEVDWVPFYGNEPHDRRESSETGTALERTRDKYAEGS